MAGGASAAVFWLLAALTVGSAVAVVLLPNIVHSALYLVLTFIGVAGLYILLEAEFLAAVQVLVYAGAVAILLIFGVMLTRRGNMRQSNPFNSYHVAAGVVSLALFILVVLALGQSAWRGQSGTWPENTVGAIAEAFLGPFVLPFEVAAVLLLVGIIGAILLAREEKRKK
ncbi:NADH-quinone oxidoreductase subunit J [Moorellaceae bacterium AZ2]